MEESGGLKIDVRMRLEVYTDTHTDTYDFTIRVVALLMTSLCVVVIPFLDKHYLHIYVAVK